MPRDAPAALCPGGSNRLTGELAPEFWGACCDADEREQGGLFKKAVLPGALLAKAHMPDLTTVVPAFDVESIEATPDEQVRKLSSLRVRFESIDFNERFIATVPEGSRSDRPARALQPRLPRLGDDDRPRGRLRCLRPPALLQLASP